MLIPVGWTKFHACSEMLYETFTHVVGAFHPVFVFACCQFSAFQVWGFRWFSFDVCL